MAQPHVARAARCAGVTKSAIRQSAAVRRGRNGVPNGIDRVPLLCPATGRGLGRLWHGVHTDVATNPSPKDRRVLAGGTARRDRHHHPPDGAVAHRDIPPDAAQRVACMSNLRQIGLALIAYATDHDGSFPAPAGVSSPHAEDWVHWQPGRDVSRSTIRRYLNNDMRVLTCRSGVEERMPYIGGGTTYPPYPFSYSINDRFTGSCAGGAFGVGWSPGPCRLSQCVNPSMKILAIEEDATAINDGEWWAGQIEWGVFRPTSVSVIHDFGHEHSSGDGTDPDRQRGRGLVAFADGHCEFFPRDKLWQGRTDPRRTAGRIDATPRKMNQASTIHRQSPSHSWSC